MYERDPRSAWTPGLADLYGWLPWQMIDLSPIELYAGEVYMEERLKNRL